MLHSFTVLAVTVLRFAQGLDTCLKGMDDCSMKGALDAQYLLQSNVKISGSEFTEERHGPQCAPGNRGRGGTCKCAWAPGFNVSWKDTWCHDGKCYARIEDYRCIGNPEGKTTSLGDGTWCFGELRDTECPVIPDKSVSGDSLHSECNAACSAIPEEAINHACYSLFGQSCEEKFVPENYMGPGQYMMDKDINRVGTRVLEMNPHLSKDELWKCELCHTRSKDVLTCSPGNHGNGGICECAGAPGWDYWWEDPWCHEGKCYSGVEHEMCIGNKEGDGNVLPLGDGTWCFGERRDTECLITPADPVTGSNDNDGDVNDNQCKDECSAIPEGADNDACLAIWQMSCEEHFDPWRYFKSDLASEKILEKIRDDSKAVAVKIVEMNPRIAASEVEKCEDCHTKDLPEHLLGEKHPCVEQCKAIPEGAEEKACLDKYQLTCDEYIERVIAEIPLYKAKEKMPTIFKEIGDTIIHLYPQIPDNKVKTCEQCLLERVFEEALLVKW